ncbi:DUF29 domain-containing protein [Gloeothece verrucosa]|uniref:DUF29 domain-containing protein n=1 Tax=Gloeothece verrucosa (strain PCC 7822) TaxID=497965 RepID=E0UAD4_GLOV7|nr:DUF29 domain-containing protein [Gloeothece verrucosa]ADN17439.1 protein of unknown function DUF29 [Gloeothece verrucosa PCC 7822]
MVKTNEQAQTLYEQDYNLWLQKTIEQLRSRQLENLDRENLIDELEGINRSDKRALESLLTRLLEHFLKLIYWEKERDYKANKWQGEITTFRIQIKRLLKDSPSLKPYLVQIFDECYLDACKVVSRLMKCKINTLPEISIFTLEQALEENWFPDVQIKAEEE